MIQPVTLDDLFARTAVATASQKPIVREWTSTEPTELGLYGIQLEQAQWNLLGLQSMLPGGRELITPIEQTILASAEATLDSSDRAAILGKFVLNVQQPLAVDAQHLEEAGLVPVLLEAALHVDHEQRGAVEVKFELPAAPPALPRDSRGSARPAPAAPPHRPMALSGAL